jgi:hypothetical protein
MHIEVVDYLPGMKISTIVIANMDMPHPSLYDTSCDMQKYSLIVPIDRVRYCVFDQYILVELKQLIVMAGVFGTSNVFGFQHSHYDVTLCL